jgi:hypothetical protein
MIFLGRHLSADRTDDRFVKAKIPRHSQSSSVVCGRASERHSLQDVNSPEVNRSSRGKKFRPIEGKH